MTPGGSERETRFISSVVKLIQELLTSVSISYQIRAGMSESCVVSILRRFLVILNPTEVLKENNIN